MDLYYVYFHFFCLNPGLYCSYVDVFYIYAIFTCECLCLHEIWDVISNVYTFIYVTIINCLFITCLYIFLKPCFNCTVPSFVLQICFLIHICTWCYQIIVSLCMVITISDSYIVNPKTQKVIFVCWGTWTLLTP